MYGHLHLQATSIGKRWALDYRTEVFSPNVREFLIPQNLTREQLLGSVYAAADPGFLEGGV